MDRNLALELVRVTEMASVASARMMGKGDEDAAAQAAVDAMRKAFGTVAIDGQVMIGEGERSQGPRFDEGEKIGLGEGSPKVDIVIEPLEGKSIVARGGMNALSAVAMAVDGRLLKVPDIYMEKIAVGPDAAGVIDLEATVEKNLAVIARVKKVYVADLTVCILDRPRHRELIGRVRAAGARIRLIRDGDVSGALATCMPESGVDVLMGTGGAPQGVMSAAALRCFGGDMQARLIWTDQEKEDAKKSGIAAPDRLYAIEEIASGNVMFAATGVTDGEFLNGVRFFSGGAKTHTVVMRSKTRTVRHINALHFFDYKTNI
jgi:fructose-1,6-bisphosphatase class II